MTTTPTLQREAATAAQAASSSLPFYAEQGDECALFAQCHAQQLPLLIKGPTGCGKTRFVEHMAARLGRPLITVSCHDDLSAADLVGRHLIGNGSTVWADGPLTRAVREGAIVYLDEVVEARKLRAQTIIDEEAGMSQAERENVMFFPEYLQVLQAKEAKEAEPQGEE